MESKDYSWAWVTADRKLTSQKCELVYACMVPTTATTDTVLYNGTDALGTPIVTLKVSTVDICEFSPPIPVYCSKGLYAAKGTNALGVLVIWRNL